jgi:intein/homing endonuclease
LIEFFIPEDSIPDELWRHFIRGFFDGDGHIGHNTFELVFTSEPFMNQIAKWFSNFRYRIYHTQGKTTDYWKFVVPIDDSLKKVIKDFLYKDATIYLYRKYDAFNTEITYNIANRVISIVEHSAE